MTIFSESKSCSRCKKVKALHLFNYTNKATGALRSECKSCQSEGRRLKLKLPKVVKEVFSGEKKRCSICDEVKNIELFYWLNKGRGCYDSACKECRKEAAKARYYKNQELSGVVRKKKDYSRVWTEEELNEVQKWKEILKILG